MFNFKNNSATCGGGGTVGSAGGKDAARCEEAKRQRCKASIIHVILNSFQDLLVRCEFSLKILRHYCTSALRIILKISGNLNVSDTAATLPPHSSSLPKGARGQKDIPSLEGRGSKGEGENLPSSGTMCHLLSHRGEWIKKILKRVQDDMNISLKRTYSHINLFTYSPYKKAAFTLAEVLITLGIIGVVAAMTIPVLIQNHKNTVVETRLKKVYTVMNQAIALAENDYGDKTYWYEDLAGAQFDKDGNIVPGSSEALKWFNKYLAPYMKIMKTEELSDGTFMVYFPDGSALQQVYSSSSRDWYFYPSNAEKCASNTPEHANGICRFIFAFKPVGGGDGWKYHYGKGFEPCKYLWDGSKDMLYRGCESRVGNAILHGMCTALIQYNGWKIPKDYPQRIK